MFHAGGHKGATRGRSSGFSRHYPGLLSHHDWKQPLRCGILFCTFSCVLFVIGVILTWLGTRRRVHDVFGESVPITGPILLAVGGLMLLLAFRQFYIARQRQVAASKLLAAKDAVKLANSGLNDNDEDDQEMSGLHSGHVKFKDADDELCENSNDPYEKSHHLSSGGYYDSHKRGMSLDASAVGGNGNICGTYEWPHASVHSPYYSMALMANSANYSYAPLAAYALGHRGSEISTLSQGPACLQLLTKPSSGTACTADASQSSAQTNPENQGASEHGPEERSSADSNAKTDKDGSAVIETSSTTLQTHPSLSGQQVASSAAAPTSSTPGELEDFDPIPESNKIFPSDYLFSHQRTASGRLRRDNALNSSASAGISNLPKQTTVMMLRTLELQETI
ncbi:hypothetical protein PoB_002736500 [Plakobranchus ocellatus]|uniref:Uncharacterized protein n=1 Tax=Plakobranchus ocellatus TaxID=259542 RepID=A0AAV4A0B4_9GAST|nr:hypothetical protein PoB_002736500 [Plakobranchus ocellatus]